MVLRVSVFFSFLSPAFLSGRLTKIDRVLLLRSYRLQIAHPDRLSLPLPSYYQTCHALARSTDAKDQSDARVNAALFNLAADKLRAHYERVNPALLPVVEATLAQQDLYVSGGGK